MTDAEIVRWVIDRFEGHAFTDDPIDTGGATKFGITQRTLQWWRRRTVPGVTVTAADVEALTEDEAVDIGVAVFMVLPGLASVSSWRIRLMAYDYGFHSGPSRAVKALQAALGVTQDGVLGMVTLHAANAVVDDVRIAVLVDTARQEFMQDLVDQQASQRAFLLGWWRRTTALLQLVAG